MMPINTLRTIINPDVLLPIVGSTNSNTIIIKENSIESNIKELYIIDIPDSALVFTLDYQPPKNSKVFQQLSLYLNKSAPKINKGCDVIICFNSMAGYTFLLFDLKSNHPDLEETKTQLLNSELYIKYIVNLLVHFDITESFQYKKCIGVTNPRLMKEKTKIYRKRSNQFDNTEEIRLGYKIQHLSAKNKIARVSLKELLPATHYPIN